MEVTVVTASSELHLVIVLEPLRVWRVLLVVDHGSGILVRIFGEGFGRTKLVSFTAEELTGEGVTVVNAENALVDSQIAGEAEITPVNSL